MHNLITIYLHLIAQCTDGITGNTFYKENSTFMTNFFSHLDISAWSNFSVLDICKVTAVTRIWLCIAKTVKSKHTKWVVYKRTTYKTDKINNTSVSNNLKNSNLQKTTSYSIKFNHYFITSDRFSCPCLCTLKRN